jgi:hypothetical protein
MKTKYYINHPFSTLRCFEITQVKNNIKSFFKHPVYKGVPTNYICPFGKIMIIILSIYLIIRLFLINNKKNIKILKIINIIILVFTFILSFMNMNAMVYLIPFFIVELFLISKN